MRVNFHAPSSSLLLRTSPGRSSAHLRPPSSSPLCPLSHTKAVATQTFPPFSKTIRQPTHSDRSTGTPTCSSTLAYQIARPYIPTEGTPKSAAEYTQIVQSNRGQAVGCPPSQKLGSDLPFVFIAPPYLKGNLFRAHSIFVCFCVGYCPPDLSIRILSNPTTYGIPSPRTDPPSSQIYYLRSVISKLIPPPNTPLPESTVLIPLLYRFLELAHRYLPSDPYILLLALRGYALYPTEGAPGRTQVENQIVQCRAQWWTPPLSSSSSSASDLTMNENHRLTDRDASSILIHVDHLRLLPFITPDVLSSWDDQPTRPSVQTHRSRLRLPLQRLVSFSASSSSLQVPYKSILSFVRPSLLHFPQDPLVVLFASHLLLFTGSEGAEHLSRLTERSLRDESEGGIERTARAGFQSTAEMQPMMELVQRARADLVNAGFGGGREGEGVWARVRTDLEGLVNAARKVESERARGKKVLQKRTSSSN